MTAISLSASPFPAFDELSVRTRWAVARIARLVNEGREAGWLPGAPLDDLADVPDALDEAAALGAPPPSASPMTLLQARLDLAPSELEALWLLVCVELEPVVSAAAQALFGPGMYGLSVQVLERLAALGAAPLPSRAVERLVALGLIEAAAEVTVSLFRRPVRATDRVLELARGRFELDPDLAGVTTLVSAIEVQRGRDPAATVAALVQVRDGALVIVHGAEGVGRATAARRAIAATGRATLEVRCGELARDPNGLVRQLRALRREERLHGAVLLLRDLDGLEDRRDIVQRTLFAGHATAVLATARAMLTWPTCIALVGVRVELPSVETRATVWAQALPSAGAGFAQEVAARYTIPAGTIRQVASAVVAAGGTCDVDAVHVALRQHLEQRLLGLADRIETRQTWDDLVLPIEELDQLIELVARVRHRHQVLETWGFADKVGRGLGLAALLSGPPGTGKTMIAGLVARELGLDLYQVDLSRIVSKYIGETEKQLGALFDAAEAGHAILLFDEADSLFGKRTEVKSSNDRYANLEVNYLLQRMEAFRGICLLTTNHETAIDPAFRRRIAFHVRVPMPEVAQRALLWRSMIPARASCADDLDMSGLASAFTMSGGYIKNAVLRAAFLAADEGAPIGQAHLWRAARAESEAMGTIQHGPAVR